MNGIQKLPPKMAKMFADKWDKGHPVSDHIREFAQGNNVICVFSRENPHGYVKRAPHRAAELRKLLSEKG